MSLPPDMLAAAAAGYMGPEMQNLASMLFGMTSGAAIQQDEQDRRWRNMAYYVDQLKSAGKAPKLGSEHQTVIIRYGLYPNQPLTPQLAKRPMDFKQFMECCGMYGWRLMDSYEAQNEPDAPAQCDCCEKRGATMRCASCGEFYCNTACQKKDWKDHKPVCNAASALSPPGNKMPGLYSAGDYDVIVLGKAPRSTGSFRQQPASHSHDSGGPSAPGPSAAPDDVGSDSSDGSWEEADAGTAASYAQHLERQPAHKKPSKLTGAQRRKKKRAAAAAAASGTGAVGAAGVASKSARDQPQGQTLDEAAARVAQMALGS